MKSSSIRDVQSRKSTLESLFCYDKSIPEEIIDKPIGLSLNRREIGANPPCTDCEAKGVILCATCSGSGLYVDSILESQGIIVKVRCLGKNLNNILVLAWHYGILTDIDNYYVIYYFLFEMVLYFSHTQEEIGFLKQYLLEKFFSFHTE